MGYVGSSDHIVVLSEISFIRPRSEKFKRRLWMWNDADWLALSAYLKSVNWNSVLQGPIEDQVTSFTKLILDAQTRYTKIMSNGPPTSRGLGQGVGQQRKPNTRLSRN